MTDLLDRLRNHRGTAHANETEAADEIERLRAELEEARKAARWLCRRLDRCYELREARERWPWLKE